jgi:hypothetical protein
MNEGKIDLPGLGVYVVVLPDVHVEVLLDADAGVLLEVQRLPLRYDAGPCVLARVCPVIQSFFSNARGVL